MTSDVWKARLNGGYLGPDWVKELLSDFAACEAREVFNSEALLASERSRFAGMRAAFVEGAERYATIISDEGIWENDLRDMKAEALRRYPDERRQQHGKAT